MVSTASRAWVEVFFITRNPIKRGRTMADLGSAGGKWKVGGGRRGEPFWGLGGLIMDEDVDGKGSGGVGWVGPLGAG